MIFLHILPVCFLLFFFLMIRRPPRSTLFPLHDALPISAPCAGPRACAPPPRDRLRPRSRRRRDRKSTRLNSSHMSISYAVYCLKKKKKKKGGEVMKDEVE